MDLSGICIQDGASVSSIQKCMDLHFGIAASNVVGLSLCVYSSLSPCVWWGNALPGEAGIGPDHHVMPGIDIGLVQLTD